MKDIYHFEFFNKALAIVFSFFFILLAYYIKRQIKTFLFPASLFALIWFFYTFIPLLVTPEVPINPFSILYIFGCIVIFSISSIFFDWKFAFNMNVEKKKSLKDFSFNNPFMYSILAICVVSTFVTSILMLTEAGFKLRDIFFNMPETSHFYAHMRGHGKITNTTMGSINLLSVYFGVICGGLIFSNFKNYLKKITLIFIIFFPVIFITFAQSTKIALFYSLGFFSGTFLLTKIYKSELIIFHKKVLLHLIAILLISLPILAISFLSRSTPEELVHLKARLFFVAKSYIIAQIYSFSDFFSSCLNLEHNTNFIHDFHAHGAYTFTSVYNFLGGSKSFPLGTFYDNFTYGDSMATNIYTIFRGLIYDFGLIGTLVYMFISGLFFHYFYYRLLIKKRPYFSSALFLIFIVYIQGTYLSSIFMARNMYVLILGTTLLLWINQKIKE